MGEYAVSMPALARRLSVVQRLDRSRGKRERRAGRHERTRAGKHGQRSAATGGRARQIANDTVATARRLSAALRGLTDCECEHCESSPPAAAASAPVEPRGLGATQGAARTQWGGAIERARAAARAEALPQTAQDGGRRRWRWQREMRARGDGGEAGADSAAECTCAEGRAQHARVGSEELTISEFIGTVAGAEARCASRRKHGLNWLVVTPHGNKNRQADGHAGRRASTHRRWRARHGHGPASAPEFPSG
jgi:hypothetical protein